MPLGAFKLNSLGRFTAPAGRTAKTVTAYGNAQVDTAQSKFGGASALFDGNGDYLNSATGFSFAGDFTVEFFVRFVSIGANSRGLASDRPPTSAGYTTSNWYIEKNTNNGFNAGISGFGDIVTSNSLVTTNTWYHIAFVRSGTTVSLYLDGTSRGTPLTCGTSVGDGDISFGAIVGLYLDGHMDEIRVSNSARYTTTFTPTTTPFVNDANTLLLLHCDGTDATTVFTDDFPLDPRITGSGSYFVNNYFGNNATYLGNDSSNRPVFAYAFAANSTYYPTMFLFRINTSDLSITVGTSYVLESLVSYYCDVCSERDGAGFRTTSGFEEYAYVGWGRGSGTTDARIAAFTFNKDALTATIGTNIQAIAAANISPVGNFSLTYVGNRTVAFCVSGGNNGNFVRQNWATRSSGSTTLTKNGGADNFARGNFGQGGAYSMRGMYPSSLSSWGFGLGTGNNGHGWHVSFSRINSTASVGVDWAGYTVAGQTPVYNTICQFVQLNNTNRFLSVCYGQFNTTVYHRATAFTVTWNTGATAPTITAGTTVDIGGASPTNGAMYGLHPGKADGEAYFIIRGSSGFEYRKLTVSTNTITVGSANSLSGVSPPSALYSADAGNIVQIGSDWYWVVGYRNANTAEVQFLVVKNPV